MVEVNRRPRAQVPSGLLSQFLNSWRDNLQGEHLNSEHPNGDEAQVASLAGRSTFAAGGDSNLAEAARDLATPINVIAGAAWNLKEECSPEDREFWIDCILRNVLSAQNRVEDLKDEVLDSNGLLKVELEEIDLSSVVREAVQDFVPLAQDHDLQFYGDPAYILGDPERIRRLVFNLLCNAINQSEPGREIKVDVWRRGAQVCLFVQDQGRGPGTSQNEQVFLPFKSLTCGSETGAGEVTVADSSILSSVQRIATAHGATIKVQGAPGQGTIYEVSFRALCLSQRREKLQCHSTLSIRHHPTP